MTGQFALIQEGKIIGSGYFSFWYELVNCVIGKGCLNIFGNAPEKQYAAEKEKKDWEKVIY